MENISFKLETGLARQIKKDLADFHYSTKTEFIREAIRDKLKKNEEERRKKAWEALFAARGILEKQNKKYFVSHAWMEKIKGFVDEYFERFEENK